MTFKAYLLELINAVPHGVYVNILIIFCAGTLALVGLKGWRKGLYYAMGLLLVEYIFLLYASTVIFRKAAEVRSYDFTPFWSYSKPELMVENSMNVVVFVPVGIVLGSLLKVKGSWLIALMVGMGISVSIEALQYFLMRGFSEVDDVMHNTIGCILGYILVLLVAKLCKSGRAERMVHG